MSRSLKVLSYNIHKGFTAGNRRKVLNQMRLAIRSVNADIVFLQEVMGRDGHRSAKSDKQIEAQFEYLADEVWTHYAYGKNAVYSSGHHGNAILSKYPFEMWENIDISNSKLEKRGILHGVIRLPDFPRPMHLMCIHLDLFEYSRQTQVEAICRRVRETVVGDEPVIICGDFNDWRQRISHRLINSLGLQEAFLQLYGEHARSFPSFFPILRLDRVYYRGIQPISAGCLSDHPWKDLSDHLALYADFAFP